MLLLRRRRQRGLLLLRGAQGCSQLGGAGGPARAARRKEPETLCIRTCKKYAVKICRNIQKYAKYVEVYILHNLHLY